MILSTHKELLAHNGANVTCKIGDKEIDDGKIQVEGACIFICQNLRDGRSCSDKKGYKYSWVISNESKYENNNQGCTNIKLINKLEYNQLNAGTLTTIITHVRSDGLIFTKDKIGEKTIEEIKKDKQNRLDEVDIISKLLEFHEKLNF